MLWQAGGTWFALATVIPVLAAVAWLVPGVSLLFAHRFRPVVMLPLAAALVVLMIAIAAWCTVGQQGNAAAAPAEHPGTGRTRPWTAWWGLAGSVLVAGAFAVWQLLENSPQWITSRDPGAYTQAGYWIAYHASLPIPTLAAVFGGGHVGLSAASFGFAGHGQSVLPVFPAGLALLVAAGAWAHGAAGAALISPVLGALAVLTVAGLTGRLAGPAWAPVGALLLAVTVPEVYTSRSAFPEPLAQLLLFGGLCLVVDALRSRRPWPLAALGGLALGLAPVATSGGLLVILPALVFLGVLLACRGWLALAFGGGLGAGVCLGLASGVRLTAGLSSATTPSLGLTGLIAGVFALVSAAGVVVARVRWVRRVLARLVPPRPKFTRLIAARRALAQRVSAQTLAGLLPARFKPAPPTPDLPTPDLPTPDLPTPDLPTAEEAAEGQSPAELSTVEPSTAVLPAPVPLMAEEAAAEPPVGEEPEVGQPATDEPEVGQPATDEPPTAQLMPVRPFGWLPGAGAILVALLAGLAVIRPYVMMVRGPADPAVAALQRFERLPVDPTRLYAENSLYWVVWYLGVPALLLGIAGLSLLTRRCLRILTVRRDGAQVPGVWLLPAAMIGWGLFTVLWQPATAPDQPWAGRQLVPVALPGLAVLAVWLCSQLTVQARRWGTGRVITPAVAVCLAAALAVPPAAATFGTGAWQATAPAVQRALTGLAFQRTNTGELAAVKALCQQIPARASVLTLDAVAARQYTQTVRGLCGVPAEAMPSAPVAEVVGVIVDIERSGRIPVLLSTKSSKLAFFDAAPRMVVDLYTQQDAHVLIQPPTTTWPVRYVLWMSSPSY